MPSKRNALQQAVYLLSRRDYSRQELVRRLTLSRYVPEEIEAAVERVSGRGYLDDAAFARNQYEQLNRTGRYGIRAIRFKLAQKGLAEAVISEITGDYDLEEEYEQALRLLAAKFDSPVTGEQKQKIARFLSARGFDDSTIERVFTQFE